MSEPIPAVAPVQPDALLIATAAMLDDLDLQEIAAADDARDLDEHLAALRQIVADGRLPCPLRAAPREVLDLTRWLEPEPTWSPEEQERAHRQRAFACAAFLRAFGEDGSGMEGQNQTLISLMASLRALGVSLDREAAGFLTWLIPHLPPEELEEHAFFGLGLLWFALSPALATSDECLLEIAGWTMRREQDAATLYEGWFGRPPPRWLLLSTTYTQRHDLWEAFGTWLADRLQPHHGPAVTEAVRRVATLLSGEGRRL